MNENNTAASQEHDGTPKFCPYCGCTELHEISDEVWEAVNREAANDTTLTECQCDGCGWAFWIP